MSDQELKEKTRKTAGLYFQDVSGEKPYDLINEDRTAEVLEVIDRLESGVFL